MADLSSLDKSSKEISSSIPSFTFESDRDNLRKHWGFGMLSTAWTFSWFRRKFTPWRLQIVDFIGNDGSNDFVFIE